MEMAVTESKWISGVGVSAEERKGLALAARIYRKGKLYESGYQIKRRIKVLYAMADHSYNSACRYEYLDF